jgi:hypothetical protein
LCKGRRACNHSSQHDSSHDRPRHDIHVSLSFTLPLPLYGTNLLTARIRAHSRTLVLHVGFLWSQGIRDDYSDKKA